MQVTFSSIRTSRVKDLAKWRTTHRLPDDDNAATRSFVAGLVATEIDADIDAIYAALRSNLGLTRRKLTAATPGDGTGAISTPNFNYSITASLSPTNPADVAWHRLLDRVDNYDLLRSAEFGAVFDNLFDTLTLAFPKPVDLEAFIDSVEANENPAIDLSYDRQATRCTLRLENALGEVTVTSTHVAIVHDLPQTISRLLASLATVEGLVAAHSQVLRSPAPTTEE